MPGSAATISMSPSDALRAAGMIDGPAGVAGKRYGSGEDEAAVGVALTMAIEFFAKNKRAGQLNVAMMLRRVLVEGQSVRAAADEAGINPRHAYRTVAEFKREMADVCRRNMWDVGVVLR